MTGTGKKGRIWAFCAALLFLLFAAPAQAAVTISFYSHDLRLFDGLQTDFPHGFVLLSGTTADGEQVKHNFGFSAVNIFIDVLWHPVKGALDDEPLPTGYVAEATQHLSFVISDDQYRAVMAVVDKWRTWPQPSYDIDTHNFVNFVKEIAQAVGLSVSEDKKFIHAPKEFLADVAARNPRFASSGAVAAAPMTPPAPAAPAADNSAALQQRLQQLRDDVANKRN
jgi:hypothetical protein